MVTKLFRLDKQLIELNAFKSSLVAKERLDKSRKNSIAGKWLMNAY